MPPTMNVTTGANGIIDSLHGVRRRIRTLGVLLGTGLVMATTVTLFLGVIVLDYLFDLPTIPRFFFLFASLIALGYFAYRWIIRPLAARMSIGDVAGHMEQAFPQFGDHVRSTVDFVRSDVPGSEMMKARVVAQATSIAASVNLNDALNPRPVAYSMLAGLAAILLAVLLAAFNSNLLGIVGNRLMGGNQHWPKKTNIEMLASLPARTPVGEPVTLKMRLAKGDRQNATAIAFVSYDGGPARKQVMTRNDDGTYSTAVETRGSNMKVWIKSGDDQTEPAQMAVVPRLGIQRVEASITPPAYAKLGAVSQNLSEAPATVVVGSDVELRVAFNKPLAVRPPLSAWKGLVTLAPTTRPGDVAVVPSIVAESVKADAKLPAITWTITDTLATGRFVATESVRFRLRAVDQDYFTNPALEEYEVITKPDQNPSVMIETPRKNEDRTATAHVPLEALAEDDFGLDEMTLVIDRLGERKQNWEIKLDDYQLVDQQGERRRFRGKLDWELSLLEKADLKPGDVLEYYVRVRDNYNYNGMRHDPVASGKLRIQIISQETLTLQTTDQVRQVSEKTRTLQNAQNRTKQETANLRTDTEKKTTMDPADRTALNRLAEQQATLAQQTKQLAQQVAEVEKRLDENRTENKEMQSLVKDVKQTLDQTAERPMTDASKKIGEASQKADPRTNDPKNQKSDAQKQQDAQERSSAMQQSEQKQQEASDQLGKAMEKMGNLGTFEQLIQKVRDALAKQQDLSKKLQELGKETLGKETKDLTAEQKKKLDEIAQEQKKAADNTDKLEKELQKAGEQTQKSDPASSQAMKQAAQQAQQQQVSSKQQQASQQAQQNQQAGAQGKQKQAELGLQQMLDTLREAERRKLEELVKALAKVQELIAGLIQRQAGHNIDNLRLQGGPDKLKQMTDELIALAGRLKDKQPATPDAPQLGNSQAQTERNTRDVSKAAEELKQGGAEISAMLTKAAGFMERAIVGIRDGNLPEAYDPNQVKALDSLTEAKKTTDKALADAQQQLDQANKDTIRQAFEKIRAEQAVVNGETVRLEKAPKAADGALNRADAVALGKLPGVQGGLATRVKEMEKALQDVGGVVYVWANQDIHKSMDEVKTDLGKPKTDEVVQAEQGRIVEQLDSMIRNLAIKPLKKDFKDPPKGGGGGGGGGSPPPPKLPSEAELRLLKDLQVAVNKSTQTIDALPNKDKAKLVGLGTRQGELRNLLDQLVQKATKGQAKLDPEPDPKERLPEEADAAKIENQEIDQDLLGGKPGADDAAMKDLKEAAQRMARSRQRLALDTDSGKTTQAIQDRILKNLDSLINQAREQEAQAKSNPSPGGGKPQPGAKPGEGQGEKAENQGQGQGQPGQSKPNKGSSPAGSESLSAGNENDAQLTKDIREQASEWGHLTPRQRQEIIEGTHDQTPVKYKKLTDGYFEALGKKGAQER